MLVEMLESRTAPSWVWGPSVSWSIVPDGTDWLGGKSTLQADMGRMRVDWRSEIRKAFAAWGAAIGVLFTESPDPGVPIGAESPTIRIGGNYAADYPRTLAWSYFPDLGRGSDVTFNLVHDWSVKGFDLFSVALHELGHAVADLKDGASPVMSPAYRGPVTLTPADVDAALDSVDVVRGPAAILSKFGER
jgi:hypothetical protein